MSPNLKNAVGCLVGATLLLSTVATPAVALPTAIDPEYGIGTTPPPLTDGATGFQLLAVDGVPVAGDPPEFVVNQAVGETQTFTLGFREPPADSNQILDPRFLGTFTFSNTQFGTPAPDPRIATLSFVANGPLPSLVSSGQVAPIAQQFSDGVFTAFNDAEYTSVFDFSSLAGGVLPAGAILSAHEVDACNADGNTERVTFASGAGEPWLRYYSDVGIGPSGPVTFDNATGKYQVDPAPIEPPAVICPDTGVISTFATTSDRSDLTITMEGIPRVSGRRWMVLAPTVAAAPQIGVVKTVNGQDVAAAPGPTFVPGEPVVWEFLVTNLGNVPLADVRVVDDQVAVDCGDGTAIIAILGVGESVTCRASGVAKEGPHTNVVNVSGQPTTRDGLTPLSMAVVSASDQSWFDAVAVRTLMVSKVADRATVAPGAPILYTITATNTGNITLTDLTVADDLPVDFVADDTDGGTIQGRTIEWSVDSLSPGQVVSFDVHGRAPAAPGTLVNRATVTVAPEDEDLAVTSPTPCTDNLQQACVPVEVVPVTTTTPATPEPSTPAPPTASPSTSAPALAATGSTAAYLALISAFSLLLGATGLLLRRRASQSKI